MMYYLNPELMQIQRNTASTTVKHLTAKEINKMKMPLPPMKLQEEFAIFVEQIDKSKITIKKHLENTKALQKSLINKIMEGDNDAQ